jgi:hypothetical protein
MLSVPLFAELGRPFLWPQKSEVDEPSSTPRNSSAPIQPDQSDTDESEKAASFPPSQDPTPRGMLSGALFGRPALGAFQWPGDPWSSSAPLWGRLAPPIPGDPSSANEPAPSKLATVGRDRLEQARRTQGLTYTALLQLGVAPQLALRAAQDPALFNQLAARFGALDPAPSG